MSKKILIIICSAIASVFAWISGWCFGQAKVMRKISKKGTKMAEEISDKHKQLLAESDEYDLSTSEGFQKSIENENERSKQLGKLMGVQEIIDTLCE